MMEAQAAPQYFTTQTQTSDTLRYRLGAEEVLANVIDQLRGGYEIKDDERIPREEQRLMNDLGVGKVEMFLSGFLNKVVHLTKYKNEERVYLQVREAAEAFLFELTLNMKRWGPEFERRIPADTPLQEYARRVGAIVVKTIGSPDAEGFVRIRYRVKVRNRRLILHMVENAILASVQRGESGSEAEMTAKSFVVQENRSLDQERPRQGLLQGLSGILGRGGAQ